MKIEGVSRKEIKGIITRPLGASKGAAGSVLLILGSDKYVGAGQMAALAALRAGCDIVGVAAPEHAALAINTATPDLITHKISADRLQESHVEELAAELERYTVLLIGPGADLAPGIAERLLERAHHLKKRVVLDADATAAKTLANLDGTTLLVNRSEYDTLLKRNDIIEIAEEDPRKKKSREQLETERQEREYEHIKGLLGNNVLLMKAPEDLLFTKEKIVKIEGGSLRATVAGTGDILAGIVASFLAQGLSPVDAVRTGAIVAKRAAEMLEERMSLSFLASDFLVVLPEILKELKVFRVVKHV
ncbi:TPA: NAD(P)H-hydrate dehydratase [Candidatus Woesearchaeota archaeon]|nr:NAD(P)H-hydrate dehydratase [Candidatus Woesearchaeota archaeon]